MHFQKRGLSIVLALAVGAGAFFLLPKAHAQGSEALEEIIVTARKRD